jgi:hypothetical protein
VRRREPDEAIEWNDYPRIPAGEYFANCFWARKYRDSDFHRWTCLLRWDVLSNDLQRTVAKGVPQWFPLGDGETPHAARRGKYFREWVRANGGPPGKGDHLSPRVFAQRIGLVEIGDTDSPAPYSVVRRIIRWDTGIAGHSVIQSPSQGRQGVKP